MRGLTTMTHSSLEPGTNGLLSGLTRRALMRRSAWLLGGVALASLLEACTVAPAPPPASTPIATKLVFLDAANIDTPEVAPRKQVQTDFFYNKALLDKAGLQPPRTLAE
jgi:hypothetical protein